MSLSRVASVLILLFPVSELAIAAWKRARPGTHVIRDQGSVRLLWVVILVSIVAAVALQNFPSTRLPLPPDVRSGIAILLLAGGLGVRWWSILTLGRFFTINVAVQDTQHVVDTGPYRWIRHPSYTGLLVAFLGVGIETGNLLSLAVLMAPITIAILYRIRIEEAALGTALGDSYVDYMKKTRRLVPGVY